MLFHRLDTEWTAYREKLGHLRAVVVDDEPVILDVLGEILEDEGFEVTTCGDAESAWTLIPQQSFDLLVTDKNLPGMSGVELIAKVHQANIDLPAVMVTGFASTDSVSDALRHGAADYIQKPFPDIRHVARRLKSVVDRRVADQLYGRVVRDLRAAVATDVSDRQAIQNMARDLFMFKQALAARPSIVLVEPDETTFGSKALGALVSAGLSAVAFSTLEEAKHRMAEPDGPLTAVVNLHLPGVIEFIGAVRAQDPLTETLVTSARPDLNSSLKALTAGASDFVNHAEEGLDIWRTRVVRMVDRARRQRLQVNLIATLYRRIKEQGLPLADALRDTLPPEQQAFLDRAVRRVPENLGEIEVDLSHLLESIDPSEEEAASDRRLHPRIPAALRVRVQQLDPVEATTGDLSRNGMFIMSDQPMPMGGRLRVELYDPEGSLSQPVVTEAEVVRHVIVAPEPGAKQGFGVRILGDEGAEYAELISKLAHKKEPGGQSGS